jgi:hypothetical protein
MADKKAPIGICDLCGEEIPRDRWYTRRGPRLYCSRECRNTANSRVGIPVRREKALQRIASGQWVNPASICKPSFEALSAGVSLSKKRAVAEGRWINPALSPEAREKLSRPRKYSGALHRAMEKLRKRVPSADLTEEEREAYHAYRRELTRRKKQAQEERA